MPPRLFGAATDDDDHTNGPPSDEEVKRIAIQMTISAFARLESQLGTMSEADMLKKYIRMCPFVPPDSPAVRGALRGVDNFSAASTQERNVHPVIQPKAKMSTGLEFKLHTYNASPPKMKSAAKIKGKLGTLERLLSLLGYVLRTLILDLPLALCFGAYLAAVWTHHVHDLYLKPQLQAMLWDEDRKAEEETYYMRWCEDVDQSAFDGSELFLSVNASTEEAYEHQLKHGFSVFPSVLSDQTAGDLRDFVRSRNHNLTKHESIYVLAQKKRYSFGLGTEEPSVANAVEELASNERLRSALEKIIGRNPALIEMTCITTTYGAGNQGWHHDVLSGASAMQFGRSFSPSYSIFIQLQNTTREMGATDACPGTHYCSKGTSFCSDQGFQVIGEDGYWRTGDALLMNMNCFHRGAAHTDPDGEDRVMLILTFAPRPRSHAESRLMSQGITFSLRWDMWGHTLDDLAHAKTRMTQPWATLRALGLYKIADADWGIDYITGGSMRMANFENGFRDEQLEEWITSGGFPLLPSFLHGEVDFEKEGWPEYYFKTVILCETFLRNVHIVAFLAYSTIQFVTLATRLLLERKNKITSFNQFSWSMVRLLFFHGIVYAAYWTALNHVDNTQWAQDIKEGRRYTNPFVLADNDYSGATTYPHREDILIETRYKTAALAMYNDFVMAHPGNRAWKTLLDVTGPLYASYSGLPTIFREQLPEYIVSSIESQQRRFLYQGKDSHWHVMSRQNALEFNEQKLKMLSQPALQYVVTGLEYLVSDCKHGHLRYTSMVRSSTLIHLRNLKNKLLEKFANEKVHVHLTRSVGGLEGPLPRPIKMMKPLYALEKPVCNSRFIKRSMELAVGLNPGEPEWGAWIQEGSVVEILFEDENNPKRWYYATVNHIASSGFHECAFYEGPSEFVKPDSVRAYVPFTVGEKLEFWKGKSFVKAVVLFVHENGDRIDVKERKSGKKVKRVFMGDVRRPNDRIIHEELETTYY